MTTNETVMAIEYVTDAELVSRTLAGDREAFGKIVSRYQILICSLAYSRIGHLGQSEDVAQETFITAWKQLRSLREPEKLRRWLCGIVRNRTKKHLEQQGRQCLAESEPLDAVAELPALEALPSEQAMTREEEAILWRTLQRLPELYREPLILFYRDHQSIEHVAAELELSEDAVKQRLSRGRKMLQEGIESFVEKALRRTAPAPAFSGAVLAGLPLGGGSTVAAGMGAAGKSTLTAKGLLAAFVLPFIGVLTGFSAAWLMFPGQKSPVTKLRLVLTWGAVICISVGGQCAVCLAGQYFDWSGKVYFEVMTGFWWLFAMGMATWIVPIYRHAQAGARAAERAPAPAVSTPRYAAIVAGTHLMMFWGVILNAWHAQDRLGAAIIMGLMVTLAVWNFFKFRDKALGPAYILQIASATVVMLTILNLRLDLWLAHSQGITLEQLHGWIPMWLVPVLTLALFGWTMFLLWMTKPEAADPSPAL